MYYISKIVCQKCLSDRQILLETCSSPRLHAFPMSNQDELCLTNSVTFQNQQFDIHTPFKLWLASCAKGRKYACFKPLSRVLFFYLLHNYLWHVSCVLQSATSWMSSRRDWVKHHDNSYQTWPALHCVLKCGYCNFCFEKTYINKVCLLALLRLRKFWGTIFFSVLNKAVSTICQCTIHHFQCNPLYLQHKPFNTSYINFIYLAHKNKNPLFLEF